MNKFKTSVIVILLQLIVNYGIAQNIIQKITWVGENNEYLNISKKYASLQKGIEYEWLYAKCVKNRYLYLVKTYDAASAMQQYNIVRITQDTLILVPAGVELFEIGTKNQENQYVFVNSLRNYKFVKLHYETFLNSSEAGVPIILGISLDIDSAKQSKVTVKDEYRNETKIYRSPLSKKDYERLLKILSNSDISYFPNENVWIKENKPLYSVLEIRYNDQIKTFKSSEQFSVPDSYAKLGDFMWEYIETRAGFNLFQERQKK